ncbi:hypothetical protein, partial [Escherichia fergusonii]|uniref:hypothetical protein n=1 Tax=Escherichia fergusonii TaxID=564 RepID=UPI001CC14A74
IHILRGVRQQQDEPGRFSICSRQAAVVPDLTPLIAKLGFWSDIDLPCWAGFGLLTLTPMIRNVPADTD